MKNWKWDQLKSLSTLKKEVGKVCAIPGCNTALTSHKGQGSNLCREHQKKLIEYGGPGRQGRPHTFHREWICSECGWDALNDPRYKGMSEEEKRRAIRIVMHADHNITRRADGGGDDANNIVCLCSVCHAIKTVKNKDYLSKK